MTDNKHTPLDPSSDAEEMMGDTSGLTGITRGGPQDGFTTSDNDKRALANRSDYRKEQDANMASEEDHPEKIATNTLGESEKTGVTVNAKDAAGDDSPHTDEINTVRAPFQQPENLGQQAANASMPDPTSDDDTLQNAQAVGTQMDEDDEHPEELGMGRDIDKAQEYHRTH